MVSFKNTIIRSIKKKQFDREYFETTIQNWLVHGKLTEAEVKEVHQVLDEVFPVIKEENTEPEKEPENKPTEESVEKTEE